MAHFDIKWSTMRWYFWALTALATVAGLATLANLGMLAYLVNEERTDGGSPCAIESSMNTALLLDQGDIEAGLNSADPGMGTCLDACQLRLCTGRYNPPRGVSCAPQGPVLSGCPNLQTCAEECSYACTNRTISGPSVIAQCVNLAAAQEVCPALNPPV